MISPVASKRDNISRLCIIIIVTFAIYAQKIEINNVNFYLKQIVVLLSSSATYELLIWMIFKSIEKNDRLLNIYWGNIYLQGIWHYEYWRNGNIYVGVWEFKQDIEGTYITGIGLDDQYRMRTVVRSVSPMIEENGAYYFLLKRNEIQKGNIQIFSRTTILIDKCKSLNCAKTMRAFTDVFGGPSDKELHQDAKFFKHDKISCISDMIDWLKNEKIIELKNKNSGYSPNPTNSRAEQAAS